MQDGAANLRSPSLDANDQKDATWDVAGGLDSLMLSVSNSNLSSLSGSKDNLSALSSVSAGAPNTIANSSSALEQESVFSGIVAAAFQPASTAAATVTSSPSIGSLSMHVEKLEADAVGGGIDMSITSRSSTLPKPSSSVKKTGSALKKGIGARKLDSSCLDVKMDSFEVVEKNSAKAAQEDEDHRLAVKLHSGEGIGSSRLAAVYQESESIYRAAPTPLPSNSSNSFRGTSSSSALPGYKSAAGNVGESYIARERFSSSKSISSDQFFGRDEEDSAAVRARLQKYGNATAISSDMLINDIPSQSNGTGSSSTNSGMASNNGDAGLGRLKESVRDFFSRY